MFPKKMSTMGFSAIIVALCWLGFSEESHGVDCNDTNCVNSEFWAYYTDRNPVYYADVNPADHSKIIVNGDKVAVVQPYGGGQKTKKTGQYVQVTLTASCNSCVVTLGWSFATCVVPYSADEATVWGPYDRYLCEKKKGG